MDPEVPQEDNPVTGLRVPFYSRRSMAPTDIIEERDILPHVINNHSQLNSSNESLNVNNNPSEQQLEPNNNDNIKNLRIINYSGWNKTKIAWIHSITDHRNDNISVLHVKLSLQNKM